MTTIFKVTMWAADNAAVPLEATFIGYAAEQVAKDFYSENNHLYHHGHMVKYEDDKPEDITPIINYSFDMTYLDLADEDEDNDWDDDDDDFEDDGNYCPDCGALIAYDLPTDDNIVRPAYTTERGDLYCDRCGPKHEL